MSRFKATARNVLEHEARSILRMSRRLSASFERAARILLTSRHPVVLVGMGKPAFIAQKISASLASTGTASFFLHPADALHGDIGRIRERSAVVLLSNSGETEEITKLLPALQKLRCRLVALTGNPRSVLSRAAEVTLDVSVESEARPLHVAPTASTTCMLAMGDALTMALVRARRFKIRDFAELHPGGSLGRRLSVRVKDVMRTGRRNPCVSSGTPLKKVLLLITQARAGSATVVDSRNRCLGIFTDGDLRRHFQALASMGNEPVSRWMTAEPLTIREDELAIRAFEVLRKHRVDELPVVNPRGAVTGLLDVQDLLDQGYWDGEIAKPR